MSFRDYFVEYALDRFATPVIENLLYGPLKALGISPLLAGIVTSGVAAMTVTWVWHKVKSWEEPQWEKINPDDPKVVEKAFAHAGDLAQRLGVDEARDIGEFQAQLRRLNYYGRDVWERMGDKLDPSDDELMHSLYSKRNVVSGLARVSRAQTLDEFKDQIRQLRQSRAPRPHQGSFAASATLRTAEAGIAGPVLPAPGGWPGPA